jgi:long-subunit acyl-CoA synthetase (AMP-forming)
VLNAEARAQCEDALARKAMEESLETQLTSLNAGLDPHERVAFVAVVAEPWTIDNELITPTLKIRRSKVEQRYLARFDEWRNSNDRVVWDQSSKSATPSS